MPSDNILDVDNIGIKCMQTSVEIPNLLSVNSYNWQNVQWFGRAEYQKIFIKSFKYFNDF